MLQTHTGQIKIEMNILGGYSSTNRLPKQLKDVLILRKATIRSLLLQGNCVPYTNSYSYPSERYAGTRERNDYYGNETRSYSRRTEEGLL